MTQLFLFFYAIFLQIYDVHQSDVTITVYNPVASQCDDTPNITADGTLITDPDSQRLLAVSRDLLDTFPYGTQVYLYISPDHPRNGYYTVADTMAKRWRNRVDICTNEKLGKWQGSISYVTM